jgi:hypothetical protein
MVCSVVLGSTNIEIVRIVQPVSATTLLDSHGMFYLQTGVVWNATPSFIFSQLEKKLHRIISSHLTHSLAIPVNKTKQNYIFMSKQDSDFHSVCCYVTPVEMNLN